MQLQGQALVNKQTNKQTIYSCYNTNLLIVIIISFWLSEFPVYAEEGSTHHLKCVPDSLSTEGMVDIKYRWMTTDGQPLTNDRYFVGDDGQLEITGVVVQDSGELICLMIYGDIDSGVAEQEQFKYAMTGIGLPYQ